MSRLLLIAALALALLNGCGGGPEPGPDAPSSGAYKVGSPYWIGGRRYVPKVDYAYRAEGIASWYGDEFHGRPTANGDRFDMNAVTAAHPTLPLPSVVLVTNLDNGRKLRVLVNDRGPYARGRVIDLSRRAAQLLGFERRGTARVRVEVLEEESRALAATPNSALAASLMRPTPAQPVQPPQAVARATPEANGRATTNDAPRSALAHADDPGTNATVTTAPVYVQVGAFAQAENARRARDALARWGTAHIALAETPDRSLLRVRLGPLNPQQAQRALAAARAAGYEDARVLRPDA